MMESEFVACSVAVMEAIWLRRFLQSLDIPGHIDKAVVIYCDNTAAIAYAKDLKFRGRKKNLHGHPTSLHLVMKYISTYEMVADPLTKLISRDALKRHVRSFGIA